MDRSTLFRLGIAVAVVCVVVAIIYLVGEPLGRHIKHALAFFAIAVVAVLFAAMNRPLSTVQ